MTGSSEMIGKENRMTEERIEHLELLTRLELTREEKEVLKEELDQMITWIGRLGEADTEGLEEAACGTDAVNVFREDEVCGSMERSDLLQHAPEEQNGMILVPAVL